MLCMLCMLRMLLSIFRDSIAEYLNIFISPAVEHLKHLHLQLYSKDTKQTSGQKQ